MTGSSACGDNLNMLAFDEPVKWQSVANVHWEVDASSDWGELCWEMIGSSSADIVDADELMTSNFSGVLNWSNKMFCSSISCLSDCGSGDDNFW